MYAEIDSSNLSPATRIERDETIPPNEIVATSVADRKADS